MLANILTTTTTFIFASLTIHVVRLLVMACVLFACLAKAQNASN
jgi:hypothetical protein